MAGGAATGGTSAAGAWGGCVSPGGEGSTWAWGSPSHSSAMQSSMQSSGAPPESTQSFLQSMGNSKFRAGEMSQDPEAFILGLERPGMAPNGESLHSWENTHTSRATGLSGCIPESRHVPVPHQGLRTPRAQTCRAGLEHEGSVWDTAPLIPSSGSGPSWSLSHPSSATGELWVCLAKRGSRFGVGSASEHPQLLR